MSSNTKPPKFFVNENYPIRSIDDSDMELEKVLELIVEKFPPRNAWPSVEGLGAGGLYLGPTGLAYLFMNVHKERASLSIHGKSCHVWAGEYLGGDRPPDEVNPEMCGVFSETACHTAVSAAYFQSLTLVEKLISFVPDLVTPSKRPDGTDWVRNYDYCRGLAGFLYLLRLARTWYPEASALVNSSVRDITDFILGSGPPWLFMGCETYLGPGHGDMSIIFQIVASDPTYAEHPTVRSVLLHILSQQMENGNWPISAERQSFTESRELVQWCHGAPGIVQCLVLLAPHFPDLSLEILTAVGKGREFTWKEGLLTKEPNLCHGISGNAFTFGPGPQRDHFLVFTREEEVEAGLESGQLEKCDYGIGYSLGLGMPGRAVGWLWRNRDASIECRGCYLTFDDV